MSEEAQLADPVPRRRRDAAASRQAIEVAARDLFATRGYANTSVRDIAAKAGLNSALVRRYFGAKDVLFRAIMERALDLRPLLACPPDRFGDHAIAIFRSAHAAASPLAMMLLSMGDPDASAISADLMKGSVIGPLATWLGAPDGMLRAQRLAILWTGYLTQVQLLPDTPDHAMAVVEAWLAKATQAIVDEGSSTKRKRG